MAARDGSPQVSFALIRLFKSFRLDSKQPPKPARSPEEYWAGAISARKFYYVVHFIPRFSPLSTNTSYFAWRPSKAIFISALGVGEWGEGVPKPRTPDNWKDFIYTSAFHCLHIFVTSSALENVNGLKLPHFKKLFAQV